MRKKKSNIESWKGQIEDSFKYISESRNYIYLVIILFLIFIAIGFFILPNNQVLSKLIETSLRDIIAKTKGLSGIELILYIFTNNLTVSFIGIFSGIFFGALPFFYTITNGSVLGYVFARVYGATGEISSLWMILPHGIFELPAVFISLGLGIKLGMVVFSGKLVKEFKLRIIGSTKVFFLVIMPLLVLAAIIEGILIVLFK